MYGDTSPISPSDLWTLEAWVEAYSTIAKQQLSEIDRDVPDFDSELTGRMNTACKELLGRRQVALRSSDDYVLNKFGVMVAGSIPFARTWLSHELGKEFATMTLRAFGLGDQEKLKKFREDFQGTFNPKTTMATRIAMQAAKQAVKRLCDAVLDGGTEAVHVNPVIGQVFSMAMGYHRMRKKMLKMIEAAAGKAATYHEGLVVPHVLHILRYVCI